MRGYAKYRIWILTVLLLAAGYLVTSGLAQTQPATPAVPAAAPVAPATPSAAPSSTTPLVPTSEAHPAAGLLQLVLGHLDPIFWTIAALSVAGLTFIIQGFIKNRTSVLMPEATVNTIREMISQRRFRELIDFTESDPSFVSKALNPALKRAPSFASMKEAMETAIGEQTAEHFRSIEYLNIIGNLGPLLGLMGTVVGMVYAFQEVSNAGGQTDVAKLTFGIAVALCHTFLGLLLAIPCLAAFGVLRTMVDRLTIRAALLSEELLLMIKPAESKAPMAAAIPQGRPMVGTAAPSRPPLGAIPAARPTA